MFSHSMMLLRHIRLGLLDGGSMEKYHHLSCTHVCKSTSVYVVETLPQLAIFSRQVVVSVPAQYLHTGDIKTFEMKRTDTVNDQCTCSGVRIELC